MYDVGFVFVIKSILSTFNHTNIGKFDKVGVDHDEIEVLVYWAHHKVNYLPKSLAKLAQTRSEYASKTRQPGFEPVPALQMQKSTRHHAGTTRPPRSAQTPSNKKYLTGLVLDVACADNIGNGTAYSSARMTERIRATMHDYTPNINISFIVVESSRLYKRRFDRKSVRIFGLVWRLFGSSRDRDGPVHTSFFH